MLAPDRDRDTACRCSNPNGVEGTPADEYLPLPSALGPKRERRKTGGGYRHAATDERHYSTLLRIVFVTILAAPPLSDRPTVRVLFRKPTPGDGVISGIVGHPYDICFVAPSSLDRRYRIEKSHSLGP